MTQVWPSATVSPSFTSIFQTVPVMWAFTFVMTSHRLWVGPFVQALESNRDPLDPARPTLPPVSRSGTSDIVCEAHARQVRFRKTSGDPTLHAPPHSKGPRRP